MSLRKSGRSEDTVGHILLERHARCFFDYRAQKHERRILITISRPRFGFKTVYGFKKSDHLRLTSIEHIVLADTECRVMAFDIACPLIGITRPFVGKPRAVRKDMTQSDLMEHRRCEIREIIGYCLIQRKSAVFSKFQNSRRDKRSCRRADIRGSAVGIWFAGIETGFAEAFQIHRFPVDRNADNSTRLV